MNVKRRTGLCLTRLPSQTIVIETPSGHIEITVREVLGKKVRLAFSSPEDVRILRKECYDRNQDDEDPSSGNR